MSDVTTGQHHGTIDGQLESDLSARVAGSHDQHRTAGQLRGATVVDTVQLGDAGVQVLREEVLTVIEVRGEGVRLGIEAPTSTIIRRSEIVEAVRNANRAAAQADAKDLISLLTGGEALRHPRARS